MIRLPFLFAAAVATALTILPAAAANAASQAVSYADLDLASPAGKALIDHRIRTAADEVCRDTNRDLFQADVCRRESVANAQAALDRQLAGTAVHLASR